MPRITSGVGSLANLDAAVSTRAAIADYTAARAAALDYLIATGAGRIGTAGPIAMWPSLAVGVSVTEGVGVYVLGAWTQIVAAGNIGACALIGCITRNSNTATIDKWIEIGQGAAASEVVVARTGWMNIQTTSVGAQQFMPIYLPQPIALAANARLAVRMASDNGSQIHPIRLITVPIPL